jgi:hypothetical protein
MYIYTYVYIYIYREVNIAYIKKKQEQAENKEGYIRALEELKEVIIDEEGPEKREQFREDRTLWYIQVTYRVYMIHIYIYIFIYKCI